MTPTPGEVAPSDRPRPTAPVAALHAATRGEGMTDSPHPGLSTTGKPDWSTHPTTHDNPLGATPTPYFSAVNSMRRTASASRTFGRYAVGLPADPGPRRLNSAHPKPGGETKRKISTPEAPLTGPTPTGMTSTASYEIRYLVTVRLYKDDQSC